MRKRSMKKLLAAASSVLMIAGTMPQSAFGLTRTWDGGVGGTGTDMSVAANWSADTLPSVNGDTAQWDGLVAGSLSIVWTGTTMGGAAGNTGLNLETTANQTGSLLIDSGANTNAMRLGNITLAAGSGAFTLGNDLNTTNITWGGATSTHTLTNNSSNTATIGSDVASGTGSAGVATFVFTGTGNWLAKNNLNSSNNANNIVTKTGTGTLTLSGANTYQGATNVTLGTVNMTGTLGNTTININPASGTVAVMNTSGNVTRTNAQSTNVGTVLGGVGVLNISAGTWSGGTSPISAGTAGHGVINVTGGTITPGQFLVAGITGAGATGVWNVSAGAVNISSGNGGTLGATANTTGVLNLTGTGSYTSNAANVTSGIYVGENGAGILNLSGTGTMTVGGGIAASTGLNIGRNSAAAVSGIVNLGAIGAGGGTITTNVVQKTGALATGIFNFHGGKLQATSTNVNTAFMNGLSSAYVYGEGGTVDNNGQSITIGQALLAPTGSGVTSLTLGGTTTGYTPGATPYVAISGGGGTGATAVAAVNGSGNLTVTITNPGVGYTSAPTVTFTGTAGLVPTATAGIGANSSGGLSFIGSGTTTLSGASTYTGTSTLTGGKLVVTGSLAGPVTVSSGTLDGTGSVGATTIGANIIANGNAGTGALTANSLSVAGATINTRTNSTAAGIVVTNALTATGTTTINPTSTTGAWATGANNLISYGSLSGALSNFTLGTITGAFNARQTNGGLVLNGNNVALQVNGDSPKWTGLDSGNWQVGTTGANKNWKLVTAGTATDFLTDDVALFDDSATSATTLSSGTISIDINAANVGLTSATFNNSTLNYVVNSSGGFGMANGTAPATLVKSGTAQLTVTTNNTYTGGTTFNGGTLVLGSAAALGNGSLTIAPGSAKTLDVTSFQTLTGLTSQAWNDDFTYNGTDFIDMGTGLVTIGGASGTRTVTVNNNGLAVGKLVDGGTHNFTVSGNGLLMLTTTGTGAGGSNINGTLTINSGATLQFNRTGNANPNTGDISATGLTGTGTITNGGADERWVFINNTADSTFAGSVTNGTGAATGFNKSGVGNMVLSGSNAYTGTTTVSAGTLTITGANGSAGTPATLTGGTLVLGNTSALGSAANVQFPAGSTATLSIALDSPSTLPYTIGMNTTANITLKSDVATPGNPGVTHTVGNLTFGGGSVAVQAGANVTGGSPAVSMGTLNLTAGSTQTTTFNPTTANAILAGVNNGSAQIHTLEMGGTSTGNQITGNITIGSGTLNLLKSGTSTWAILGTDGHNGTTTVSGGTLQIGNGGTGGTLGGSSITNNGTIAFNLAGSETRTLGAVAGTGTITNTGGNKLVFTGAAGTQAVTNNQGTIDGTGSIGATTIAIGATIANGNGASGALTMASLTFAAGPETANIRTSSPGLVVTGALTSTGATVTINPTPTSGIWSSGPNNLISYGSLTGSLSDFALGTLGGTLGPRQTNGGLVLNGNNIALQINGDTPKWTGALSSTWSTATLSSPKNWKLITAGTTTDFIANDVVVFDDSATGTTTADINAANVSTTTVTFNNSTKNYTINGTGGFGIAAGTVSKTGTGTVTINSANTTTGALTVNGGTVKLTNTNAFASVTANPGTTVTADFSAGNTTTNIFSSTGTIAASGATLNVLGHATNVTSQALAGAALTAGGSTLNVTNNGADVAVNVGAITRNNGGTLVVTLPSGTQSITNGVLTSTANSNDLISPALIINGGGAAANNAATGYTFGTNSAGNIVPYTLATAQSAAGAWGGIPSGGTGTLNYDVSSAGALGATGLLRTINTLRYTGTGANQTGNTAGADLMNLNGFMNSGTGTFVVGTNNNVANDRPFNTVIGANRDLIIAPMSAGITFLNPIKDNAGGASDITVVGNNTATLSGVSIYTGATNVSGGTLLVSGTGSINTSSGIKINGAGARFVQTSSVASTPAITLTQGTLDGTTTVGTVTVGNATGGIVTNGNGGTAALTMSSLTFNGIASLNPNVSGGTAGIAVTGALTVNSGNGKVTVNPSGVFTVGVNNLVSFGTYTGTLANDFTLGTVSGASPRAVNSLVLNGSNIALNVGAGEAIVWAGAAGPDGTWSTDTTGNNAGTNHWALATAHTNTNFWASDIVQFNDTVDKGAGPVAPSTTNVVITGANVAPGSTTFNNSTLSYTISSSGAFGIGGTGTITKSGTNTVTLTTNNTTTGVTTINAGTLQLGNGTTDGSLASTSITDNGSLVYNLVGNSTYAGAITGTGTVTKTGGGNLTLTSTAHNLSGGVSVNGGTLVADAASLSAGPIAIGASGTMTFTGTNAINTSTITGSGAIVNSTANTIIFKGDQTGFTGSFNHTAGANNTQFNGSVTGSQNAAYTLTAGELIFAGVAGDTGVDVSGNYTVKMGSLSSVAGTIRGGNSASGTTTLEVGNLNTNTTIAGALNNGAAKVIALTKVGTGSLTLAGGANFSGATTVNGGSLVIASTYAPVTTATANATVGAAGTLNVNSSGVASYNSVSSPSSAVLVGGTLNVSGSGTSTMKSFNGTGTLNLSTGRLELTQQTPTPITYASDIGTLALSAGAVLDVKNNAVQIRSTDTTDTARNARWAQVLTGQNNFDNNGQVTWDGPGIVSSTARTNNVGLGVDAYVVGVVSNHDLAKLSADGGAAIAYDAGNPWLGTVSGVGADDILVRMTYAGDTNLDGTITIDDYNNIDGTFSGLLPTNYGWVSGDFDFSGAITIDDYNAIDTGFLYQGGQLTQGMIAARTAMFGADYVAHLETVAAAFASVPEPTTAGVLAVGVMGLLARRRRKA